MKKIVALLLTMLMVLSLCACGAKEEAPAEAAPAAAPEAAAPVEAAPAAPAAPAEGLLFPRLSTMTARSRGMR